MKTAGRRPRRRMLLPIRSTSQVSTSSLATIGRVNIKWADDLVPHLNFDRQYRALSVFCLPIFRRQQPLMLPTTCMPNVSNRQQCPPVSLFILSIIFSLYNSLCAPYEAQLPVRLCLRIRSSSPLPELSQIQHTLSRGYVARQGKW